MASALIETETLDGERLREMLSRVVPIQTGGDASSNGNGTKPLVDVPNTLS